MSTFFVVFVIMATNVLSMALAGLTLIPFLAKHNIDPSIILPGNLVYGAVNDGKLYLLLIAILVYVVAAVMISARAFKNKELEF